MIDGIVIPNDGSRDPIRIATDGCVRLIDYYRGAEAVQLAPDFMTLLEDNVHD